MSTIYYVRHQAGGVMHAFPFSSPPTDAQIAGVVAHAERQVGGRKVHSKTGEPYWHRIEEVSVLGPDDTIPDPAPPAPPPELAPMRAEANVKVTNP